MRLANNRVKEIFLIILGTLAIYFLVSLVSYDSYDPSWSYVGSNKNVTNAGGIIGAFLSDLCFYIWGMFAYWIPIGGLYGVYLSYKNNLFIEDSKYLSILIKIAGFILILISGSALSDLYMHVQYNLPNGLGGLIGKLLAGELTTNFNKIGASLFLIATFLIGIILFTGVSIISAFSFLSKSLVYYYNFIFDKVKELSILLFSTFIKSINFLIIKIKKIILNTIINYRNNHKSRKERKEAINKTQLEQNKNNVNLKSSNIFNENQSVKISKKIDSNDISQKAINKKEALSKEDYANNWDEVNSEAENLKDIFTNQVIETKSSNKMNNTANVNNLSKSKSEHINIKLPALGLLDSPDLSNKVGYTEQQLQDMGQLVESKLLDFGLKVQVVEVSPGPVIVRLELMLAPGTKVSRLTTISKDIARSLSIESVRVVEVIPGKPYVGIEIPNQHREIVFLREVLQSSEYQTSKSPLTLVLGKDISGKSTIADLSKMPHLLVAGTTGAGKSVGINAMILSILFKSSPSDVRLIMIDPKMLELAIYEGIPHLLTPVVTDMKDAANVLRWCVAEMDQRYKLMAALGVRSIVGYNDKVEKAIKKNNPIYDPLWPEESQDPPPILKKLPYIVVIVDEFADMIMVVGKKVEELIARIAQKARAAGIHMILATQRPSVDVITGLIKANVPTRIAFQVSSKIDSRTILDQQGAENLLGQGDMLFLPPGTGIPNRVHGAFVADHEVHAVVDEIKKDAEPDYIPEILNKVNVPGLPKLDIDNDDDTELDELYDESVQFVLENKKTSISALQRRFKIGYNRAARIIEHMEEVGVLSPVQSNGLREILITDGVG